MNCSSEFLDILQGKWFILITIVVFSSITMACYAATFTLRHLYHLQPLERIKWLRSCSLRRKELSANLFLSDSDFTNLRMFVILSIEASNLWIRNDPFALLFYAKSVFFLCVKKEHQKCFVWIEENICLLMNGFWSEMVKSTSKHVACRCSSESAKMRDRNRVAVSSNDKKSVNEKKKVEWKTKIKTKIRSYESLRVYKFFRLNDVLILSSYPDR